MRSVIAKLFLLSVICGTFIFVGRGMFSTQERMAMVYASEYDYPIEETTQTLELDENQLDAQGVYYNLNKASMTASVGSYPYSITENTSKYAGANDGVCVIPEKVSKDGVEYTVTQVAVHAFYRNKTIDVLVLPDTVTDLQQYAFSSSSLRCIYIGAGVSYEGWAFHFCEDLEEIRVSEDNQYFVVQDGILYSADRKVLHYNPPKLMGSGLTTCTIPEGVEQIEEYAFAHSRYAKVELPSTLKKIADYAFDQSIIREIDLKNASTIERFAFRGCDDLRYVKLPDSTITVRANVFDALEMVEGLLWTKGFTIDTSDGTPFDSSPYLRCVVMEEGTTQVNTQSFCNCDSLETIIIPDSVTIIKSGAFRGCSNLKRIYIPSSVDLIGSSVFSGNDMTIYGESGSVAETYASENGFSFVDVSEHNHASLSHTTIFENDYMKVKGRFCDICGYGADVTVTKKDGLVAGTTGSGKSELLQTYILSMALRYHPYEVGFMIIDFKGGGMANQFEKLPHLLGSITNIDGKEIDRSLRSIKAELKKRQRLFKAAEVNHIDKYIRKYRAGEVAEPIPHLIVIVDEFAELKADQPDFMKELISAARIGRSLGVHLILATQKPSGQVDEQIWSNSRFKLCLKVQSQQDSNEVIKSPLAAEIREAGRAYFQVGNNEVFELVQTAYSGASENVEEKAEKTFTIYEITKSGRRVPVYRKKETHSDNKAKTQLESVIDYVDSYCEKQNIEKIPNICLRPLEKRIEYSDEYALTEKKLGITSKIGIFDDPDNQSQQVYEMDYTNNNIIIAGSSQSGKTNLLQTMIRGLISQYSPEDVNLYVLDFGSMVLKNFEGACHVGGVVYAHEEEKCRNLFKLLEKEILLRKTVFAEVGVSSYTAYLEAGFKEFPQIILMIDNLTSMRELYLKGNKQDEILQMIESDERVEKISHYALRKKLEILMERKDYTSSTEVVTRLVRDFYDEDAVISLAILHYTNQEYQKSAELANAILVKKSKERGYQFFLMLYFQIHNFYFLTEGKPDDEMLDWIKKASEWCVRYVKEYAEEEYLSVYNVLNELLESIGK